MGVGGCCGSPVSVSAGVCRRSRVGVGVGVGWCCRSLVGVVGVMYRRGRRCG